MKDWTFQLCGAVAPFDGPAFLTPLFRAKSSNRSWVQEIQHHSIQSFLVVDSSSFFQNTTALEGTNDTKIGSAALYAYRDSSGRCHASQFEEMRSILRSDVDSLGTKLYLKRSIARFIEDSDLFAKIQSEIDREKSNPLINFKNYVRFHERNEIERHLFISRRPFKNILGYLHDGKNVIISGRRGSGKTTLLKHIQSDLDNEGLKTIYVNVATARGIARGLFNCARSEESGWLDIENFRNMIGHFPSIKPRDIFEAAERDTQIENELVSELLSRLKEREKRIVVILDDFDYSYSSIDSYAELFQLLGVQFVFSTIKTSLELHVKLKARDFKVEEIQPLNSNEVRELIAKIAGRNPEDDLKDLLEFQISQHLHSLNFRDVLQILHDLSQKTLVDQAAIQNALEVHFERMYSEILTQLSSSQIQWGESLVSGVLSAIAEDNHAVGLYELALKAGGALRFERNLPDKIDRFPAQLDETALKTVLVCLKRGGLLSETSGSKFKFSSAAVGSWWRKRA